TQGFKNCRPAAHEGVSDEPWQVLAFPIFLCQGSVTKLCKKETAKQAARPSREPLMNTDDWPIALLNLFFSQSQSRNKGSVEAALKVEASPSLVAGRRGRIGRRWVGHGASLSCATD